MTVILYTSGTTGRAKGAISTHRMMIANVQNTFYMTVAASMMWGSNDLAGGGQPVALITAPLFHATGCQFRGHRDRDGGGSEDWCCWWAVSTPSRRCG